MAGHISLPFVSAYHATKHAVVTISESLHYELGLAGAQVKVSVLCPGFVRTNIMDDSRHRPADLAGSTQPTSEAAQAWREGYREFVSAGLDPAHVATRVLEAIRAERFWVFPHPQMLSLISARAQTIVEERNPELELPPEMRALKV